MAGEIARHSDCTVANRRLIVKNFFWFLAQQEHVTCGVMELRAFFAYFNHGHKQPGGRWGNPQQCSAVKPATVATYHQAARLQDLDEAVRRYLAWQSILAEKTLLNLDPHQVKQAETQLTSADGAVTARVPEAYQWLLVPSQSSPQSPVELKAARLTGQDALAVRASRKLRNDEDLITGFAATRLRMELDRVPLWRGDHVAVKQLVEDFARYPYLPRLRDGEVLLGAVRSGIGLLTMQQDSFAYADSYDEAAQRYRGLRAVQALEPGIDVLGGLLVKPDVARRQIELETPTPRPIPAELGSHAPPPEPRPPFPLGPRHDSEPSPPPTGPKRYHGTVPLEMTRVGRDAGRIADELISHLAGLVGANVRVTLEIEAEIPGGAPEAVVRTVTENSRTLKFTSHGFESEWMSAWGKQHICDSTSPYASENSCRPDPHRYSRRATVKFSVAGDTTTILEPRL